MKTEECKEVRAFQKGLALTHEAVSKTENLKNVAKVGSKAIELFSLLTGKVSLAFKMLSSHLRETVDIIESFALVGRFKELACPENGEYFLKKSSWQKCADRILLTASGVLKTINLAAKFTFINLGKIAKLTLGKVSLLWLVPESLVAISNIFSIWDNKIENQKINKKIELASGKVEKWATRSALIKDLRAGDCETIFNLKNGYQVKVASLEREIYGLGAEAVGNKETAKKTEVLNKYRSRLELIAKDNYAELADDLAKQDIPFKHKHWSVVYHNEKLKQNKKFVGTASSISKIFIISMVGAGMALGLSTLPWTVSVIAAGIAVDSLSLAKSLYNPKPQELPKKAIAVV